MGSIQWDDPVHSISWGLWLLNEGLWILGCATWEQSISHQRDRSWLLQIPVQLSPAPGFEDILGGMQCALSSGHPGDNSTATQINQTQKIDSRCKFSFPQSHIKLTCGRESMQSYHIPQPHDLPTTTNFGARILDFLPNIPAIGQTQLLCVFVGRNFLGWLLSHMRFISPV